METLPPEVMVTIGEFLPVEDLVSCCAVSLWWREVFGCDEVWRPRCDADSEEHLRTTPCRVEPKFASPESEDSTLSPIGRWRTAYMREKHLWKNWMHGNCVKDEISNTFRQAVFLKIDFVITVRNDFIQLINTSAEPPVCVAKFPCGSTGCKISVVQSDTFIVWDGKNTVQVIRVDWGSYTLSVKHMFCVSEKVILYYDVVNTLFVGLENNLLHIWDLEKATKLKTECGSDSLMWFKVGHDKKCENVVVVGIQDCDYCLKWCLHMYNVKELRFWPFTKNSCSCINSFAILDDYIAVGTDVSIQVYNYQTSQRLHVFFSEVSVVCVGNSFMFVSRDRDLVLLSPSTGVITSLLSNVWMFRGINEKLYILYTYETHEPQCQLWKVTPKSAVKITTLTDGLNVTMLVSPKITLAINQTCSKAIQLDYRNALKPELFTFW